VKLYSVHFEVSIREIGPLEEPEPTPETIPLTEGISKDSPLHDAAELFERMQAKGMFPGPMPYLRRRRRGALALGPGDVLSTGDGMSINETVETTADSFEELQGILAKFHAIAAALSTDAQLDKLAR